MLRFCSLGSGSTGNATLIEGSGGITTTRVLVDCGFSLRELERRLARIGLVASDINAVFVTHEHGDHVGCAFTLARKHGIPLWTSRGTWRAIGQPELPPGLLNFARDLLPIALGDLELTPYTVPHDAHEPLQLRATDGAWRLGILTDAGSATAHLLEQLRGCDALLLECNHDRQMLAHSSYPASLKARIGGRLGHLANDTAAEILSASWHSRLRHLVAAHLSERNNRPDLARTALAAVFGGRPGEIGVADPAVGFDWRSLD
jgi:phosphoribosyl 1,2-cyclic phosphodiesterase